MRGGANEPTAAGELRLVKPNGASAPLPAITV